MTDVIPWCTVAFYGVILISLQAHRIIHGIKQVARSSLEAEHSIEFMEQNLAEC